MALELEALETGRRLAMHDSDSVMLVGLAHRHGWRPSEGLSHYYLPREGRRVASPSEARALGWALEEALRDLPRERRREFRPIVGALGGFLEETSRRGTDAEYERYFSWGRRWIVEEAVRLCRQGTVEIRPIGDWRTSQKAVKAEVRRRLDGRNPQNFAYYAILHMRGWLLSAPAMSPKGALPSVSER